MNIAEAKIIDLIYHVKRVKELKNQKNVTQEDVYNDTGIRVARIEHKGSGILTTRLCADWLGILGLN